MGGIKNKLSKLSNKVKTLLHMPHSLSSKERADEMTQSSQSGEVNKVATLSIKPKSTLFYVVTSLVAIMLLTILAISIKLSFLRAASNEGANDTGVATLNSVSITKLGSTNSDGTSLTVTYSDGSQLSANKDNNEILNNDEVIYEASYNVTAPGTITLSLIMPANNVINEASISEAGGCMAGSKVEKADITNSDGTITKSYTNNKATCIINPTTTGTTTWTISTNPWGGNNQEIQPTLAISGQEQTTKPEAVKTVGKGDYGLTMDTAWDQSVSNGYDRTIYPTLTLYANKTSSGAVGIAPLDNEWSIDFDTSALPSGWKVGVCRNYDTLVGPVGGTDKSVVYSGDVSCAESEDGNLLTVTWLGGVTGAGYCPIKNQSGGALNSRTCLYAGAAVLIDSPTVSLTPESKDYSMRATDIKAVIAGVGSADIPIDNLSYSWQMSNRAYGTPIIWGSSGSSNIGWVNFLNTSGTPVHVGQNIALGDWIQLNTVPTSVDNIANNLNYCTTWNPSVTRIISGLSKSGLLILGDYRVQYGVIGTDMSVLPPSLAQTTTLSTAMVKPSLLTRILLLLTT